MTDTTKLSACCVRLVESYRAARDGDERDQAALHCSGCEGRVVLRQGAWRRES